MNFKKNEVEAYNDIYDRNDPQKYQYYEVEKLSSFVKPSLGEDLEDVFILSFGLSNVKTRHVRKVYTVYDLLGDLGGVW